MTEAGSVCFRNKAVQYLTSDRISNLPSNIMDNILMCLPLRDAARTSILSKAWRHKWANIPQLVFDDSFLGISQQGLQSTSCELIMKRVYEVLLLHFGPLHKFHLSTSGLKSCPEIDRVILFLSKKDIQGFHLLISRGEQCHHKLPSCLFSCLQLQCLWLRSCIFKPPPSFKGFSELMTLDFQKVHFDADSFENFISNCPLLKTLSLESCTEISCLELNAPNLQHLDYVGIYKRFCFKNTPLLADVFIYQSSTVDLKSRKEKFSNLIEIFSCLPAVQTLAEDYYFLKNLGVPDASARLQTTLDHLKFIALYGLCLAEMEEVLRVLCLLRSSPNLRKLLIKVFHKKKAASAYSFLQLLESDGSMDFSLNQLQEVELQCFTGTRSEVQLAKFLLARSSTLRKMHIKFSSKMVDNEKFKMLKDLIRFKRASPDAEVICGDFNEVRHARFDQYDKVFDVHPI